MKSYYYQHLNSNGRRAYDDLTECIRVMGHSVRLSMTVEQAMELFRNVRVDHPEFFWLMNRFLNSLHFGWIVVRPQYLYSSLTVQRMQTQIGLVRKQILDSLIHNGQSDYDKVLQVHNWVTQNVTYDTAAASSLGSFSQGVQESHSIVGPLLSHKGVCDGFSSAMKFLLDGAGVECWTVDGSAKGDLTQGPHAWNIVKINGVYQHVDATFDFSKLMPEVMNYSYFGLSDDHIGRDHTWKRINYPACPDEPYNYFRMNNALLSTKENLINFLKRSFDMEEPIIQFKVADGSPLELQVAGLIDDAINEASNRCRDISIRSYNKLFYDRQHGYVIIPTYTY